jgi:hypothetical protein
MQPKVFPNLSLGIGVDVMGVHDQVVASIFSSILSPFEDILK